MLESHKNIILPRGFRVEDLINKQKAAFIDSAVELSKIIVNIGDMSSDQDWVIVEIDFLSSLAEAWWEVNPGQLLQFLTTFAHSNLFSRFPPEVYSQKKLLTTLAKIIALNLKKPEFQRNQGFLTGILSLYQSLENFIGTHPEFATESGNSSAISTLKLTLSNISDSSNPSLAALLQNELAMYKGLDSRKKISVFFSSILKPPNVKVKYYYDYIQSKLYISSQVLAILEYKRVEDYIHYLYCITAGLESLIPPTKDDALIYLSGTWVALPSILINIISKTSLELTAEPLTEILRCIRCVSPHFSRFSVDARFVWLVLNEKAFFWIKNKEINDTQIKNLSAELATSWALIASADPVYFIRSKTVELLMLAETKEIVSSSSTLDFVRSRLTDNNKLVSNLAERFVKEAYTKFSVCNHMEVSNSPNPSENSASGIEHGLGSNLDTSLYFLLRYLTHGINKQLVPPVLASASSTFSLELAKITSCFHDDSFESKNLHYYLRKALPAASQLLAEQRDRQSISIAFFGFQGYLPIDTSDFIGILDTSLIELSKKARVLQLVVLLAFVESLKTTFSAVEPLQNWVISSSFKLANAYFLTGMFDQAYLYLCSHMDYAFLGTGSSVKVPLSHEGLKEILLLFCRIRSASMRFTSRFQPIHGYNTDIVLYAKNYIDKMYELSQESYSENTKNRTISEFLINYTDISTLGFHKNVSVSQGLNDQDFIDIIELDISRDKIDSELAEKSLELAGNDLPYERCLSRLRTFEMFESVSDKILDSFSLLCRFSNSKSLLPKLLSNLQVPEPMVRGYLGPQSYSNLNRLLLLEGSSIDRIQAFCSPEITSGYHIYDLLDQAASFYSNEPSFKLQTVLNSVIEKSKDNFTLSCSLAEDMVLSHIESDTRYFSDLFDSNSWFNKHLKFQAFEILLDRLIFADSIEVPDGFSIKIAGIGDGEDISDAITLLQTARIDGNDEAKKIQHLLNLKAISEAQLDTEYFDKVRTRSAVAFTNLQYALKLQSAPIMLQTHIDLAHGHSSATINNILPTRFFGFVCSDSVQVSQLKGPWVQYLYPMLAQLVCGLFYHSKQVRDNCYTILQRFIESGKSDALLVDVIGKQLEKKDNYYLAKLVNAIRKHKPGVVLSSVNFCVQSKKMLVLYDETVNEALVDLKYHVLALKPTTRNKRETLELLLKPLISLLNQKPESKRAIAFYKLYKADLESAISFTRQMVGDSFFSKDFWARKESFGPIQAKIAKSKPPHFDLHEAGIGLSGEQAIPIPLPIRPLSAIYSKCGQEMDICYIESISPNVKVLSHSKTEPRIIETMARIGSEVKSLRFMLKGKEDLNSDLKIMKMWQTIKQVDYRSNIMTFGVVPIGYTTGYIEFKGGLESLYSIYKGYFKTLSAGLENRETLPELENSNPVKLYEAFARKHSTRRGVYNDLLKHVPPNLVHKRLVKDSSSSYEFLVIQNNFVKSLAAISVLGYLVGLGDRHLDNIMIEQKTGRLMHVDLNLSFDRGLMLNVPEVVPFRLTNSLQYIVGTPNSSMTFEGMSNGMMFLENMTRIAVFGKILKEQLVLGVMSSFVLDPPTEWYQYRMKSKSSDGLRREPRSGTQRSAGVQENSLESELSVPTHTYSQPTHMNVFEHIAKTAEQKTTSGKLEDYSLRFYSFCERQLAKTQYDSIKQTGLVAIRKSSFIPAIPVSSIYNFGNKTKDVSGNDNDKDNDKDNGNDNGNGDWKKSALIARQSRVARYIGMPQLFGAKNAVLGARLIAVNAQNAMIAKLTTTNIKQYDLRRRSRIIDGHGAENGDRPEYNYYTDSKFKKDRTNSRKQCTNLWSSATDPEKLASMYEGWTPWF